MRDGGVRSTPGDGPSSPADDLVRHATAARTAPVARRSTRGRCAQALVDLHEFWLTTRAPQLGINAGQRLRPRRRRRSRPARTAALLRSRPGPAARRRDPRSSPQVADQLWYPLWDAHIKLDHSVRTVPQALQVAAADIAAALGMLEPATSPATPELSNLLIGGVRRLAHRHPQRVRRSHRAGARRAGRAAARSPTAPSPTSRTAAADCATSSCSTRWRIAQLTDACPGLGPSARRRPGTRTRRLLDVRTELHRVAGRARDQLRAQDADEIGAALRIGDRFDLARMLSDCAHAPSATPSTSVCGRPATRCRGAVLSRLRRVPVRRPLDEGVVEHAGEVVLARDARPSEDPGLMLRVAAAAGADRHADVGARLNRLSDSAPELREPWPKEALNDLLVLLGSGTCAIAAIEALDRTGLWGRLLPEWGAVRDLPPRDAVHTWTVDRHLVETAAYAASWSPPVSRARTC